MHTANQLEDIPGSPYNSLEYYPPGYKADPQPHVYGPIKKVSDWSCVASKPPGLINYYDIGGIEVINYIKAKLTPEQYKGYLLGNIYKYSGRLQYKGEETKDIKKLVEYTQWLKEHNANHA